MFQIDWKLKSYIYRILYFFKLDKTLFFIQKKITKRSKVKIGEIKFYWSNHLQYLKNFNSEKILEFGAGKSLEQNIYLSYKSNSKFDQTLIDVSSMIDLNLFNKASEQISKLLNVTRKPFVKSIEDIKKFYNITYFAPCNIDEITKKNIIFDACISSASLEHFPKNALDNTFAALKKTIKKNGIISVAIDYSDHYSHTDNSIGHLNFLQFSDSVWEKYNTPFLFQNRFRHQNYRELFSKLGYEIVSEVKGKPGIPPKFIDDKFDSANKETYLLWGLFLLKIK
tara:strand:- start:114 stop:959 length:846 start_codon:yes stop_codon:yes gene_type:complete